jgi:protein-tyrosine phosphatase
LSFAYAVWFLQASLSRELSNVKLNDSLFISRRLFGKELPQEVNRVCDLSSEFSDPARIRRLSGYLCYPILDASTCDPSTLIELAKSLPPMPDSPLLIHCANGHGRTGMFAAIWLLTHGFAQDAAQAIQLLKAARPQLKLGTDQHATVENAAAILTRQ